MGCSPCRNEWRGGPTYADLTPAQQPPVTIPQPPRERTALHNMLSFKFTLSLIFPEISLRPHYGHSLMTPTLCPRTTPIYPSQSTRVTQYWSPLFTSAPPTGAYQLHSLLPWQQESCLTHFHIPSTWHSDSQTILNTQFRNSTRGKSREERVWGEDMMGQHKQRHAPEEETKNMERQREEWLRRVLSNRTRAGTHLQHQQRPKRRRKPVWENWLL